ncbi:MAG: SixA phosphatase family protein [Acidimicrobiales bacterium]
MSLLVVRHAHAGKRSAWSGADRLRSLSEKGAKQALDLADALAPHHPARILSSPTVRCMTTVEPLGERLGLDVVVDDRLDEGAGTDDVRSLLDAVAHEPVVLCTHGDVVPQILRRLVDEGMTPEQGLRWAKGSTWLIEQSATGWGTGTYLAPPGS